MICDAVPYGRKTQKPSPGSDIHILWMTAGLSCDRDSVSITTAHPAEHRRHSHRRNSGQALFAGRRVRLRPLGRGDIMAIALDGMTATIVSIEQDFENRIHLAVMLDDDPGRDLGASGQPGHRFFFGVDEVELLAKDGDAL
jgi:hypothetical protein